MPNATLVLAPARSLPEANWVHFELLQVIYGLEGMGIMLHNTGKCKGRILDELLSTIFRLGGDKIERLDTYISDVPMLKAYVAQELR